MTPKDTPHTATQGASESSEPLCRFGHHPDPAIDFCVEIEAIEAEIADLKAGLEPTMALQDRIDEAICFRVGGDARAVAAKNALRAALAQRQPAPADPQAPPQEAREPQFDSTNPSILQALIDSLEVIDGAICYDHMAMYECRDAIRRHGSYIDSDRKARQQEALQWRDMKTSPPCKTGRYVVCHAGGVGGDAYYTAKARDTHYPVGWSQVPAFGPTHWIDAAIAKGPSHE